MIPARIPTPTWMLDLVGKPFEDYEDELREAYPQLRVKKSGYLYTQDFRAARLNVSVDDDGIITGFNFG